LLARVEELSPADDKLLFDWRFKDPTIGMRSTKDIFCTVVVIESTFMIDSQVHLSVLDYHKVLDGEVS